MFNFLNFELILISEIAEQSIFATSVSLAKFHLKQQEVGPLAVFPSETK